MKIETDTKIQILNAELSGYEIAVRAASIKMEALADKFRAEAIICNAKNVAKGLCFKSKIENRNFV